jgi:protein O-GlcNAc transferase
MSNSSDETSDLPDQLAEGLRLYRAAAFAEAEQPYRAIVEHHPHNAVALHMLGLILRQRGELKEAIATLRRALEASPHDSQLLSNLGGILTEACRSSEAIVLLRKLIQRDPGCADAHYNLGCAWEMSGNYDNAEDSYRIAAQLQPANGKAFHGLGRVLGKQYRASQAAATLRRALQLLPQQLAVYQDLAVALSHLGLLDESLATYRAALALPTAPVEMHSATLCLLHCSPQHDAASLFDEHVRWAKQFAQPHYPSSDRFTLHDRTAPRRLRIGYVSPDFRESTFTRFAEPVLACHDHRAFEVYGYSGVVDTDSVTRRLQTYCDQWRNITGLADGAAEDLIRSDRIDILVDLTGHFHRNRTFLFARKPAPIQVGYIGYPGTTGLVTMDWRITDWRQDPERSADVYHTERLYRLDRCCWCYDPGGELSPVRDLPAMSSGRVTFGVFNRLIKVTTEMIAVWSKVLQRVLGSKLMVLVEDLAQTDCVSDLMSRHGVERDRLIVKKRCPRRDYLRLYHEVDIALDTFPYAGHTTTCDALWMGVPTVTLAGNHSVSRVGASILSAVGLPDWVCSTLEQYADTAVEMAHGLHSLSALRQNLREKVSRSPLGDARGLTKALEGAYQNMWAQWCRA